MSDDKNKQNDISKDKIPSNKTQTHKVANPEEWEELDEVLEEIKRRTSKPIGKNNFC